MSFSSNFGRAIDLANASIKSKTKFAGLEADIGTLSNLATTNKSSLVAAVNELKSMVAALAPVITSGQSISGNTAASVNYTVTGSNITVSGNIKRVSWSASSLPSGLSIDASTGVITGTVTTAGTYNFAVSVTTNIGTATENVTAVIEMHSYPPSVDSGSFSCNMTQELVRYIPAGTNTELDSSKGITSVQWSASNLPSGLSINSSTGNITGTPPTAGTWNATVTCTTNYGSASNTITITVNKYYPPKISLTAFDANMTQSVSGVYGSGTNVDIDSSKGITSVAWSASGLPSGLSINSSTGQITGAASSPGTWTATITCTTNYGTASRAVTVTINKYYPPDIGGSALYFFNGKQLGLMTSNLRLFQNISIQNGNEYFYGMIPFMRGNNTNVDSDKGITSVQWSVSGLPSGLYLYTETNDGTAQTLDNYTTYYKAGDAYIVGNPTVTGTFTAYFTCTNNYGSSTRALTITVKTCSYPPKSQTKSWTWAYNTNKTYYLGDANYNLQYSSSKDNPVVRYYLSSGTLPSGTSLAISSNTLVIRGTPNKKGTYNFTVSVTTTQGTASITTTCTVS